MQIGLDLAFFSYLSCFYIQTFTGCSILHFDHRFDVPAQRAQGSWRNRYFEYFQTSLWLDRSDLPDSNCFLNSNSAIDRYQQFMSPMAQAIADCLNLGLLL